MTPFQKRKKELHSEINPPKTHSNTQDIQRHKYSKTSFYLSRKRTYTHMGTHLQQGRPLMRQ